MTEYNVHEALYILKNYYVTDSMQMVTRWIREGKIKAIRSENRKDGWRIAHDDLFDFIEEDKPGLHSIMLKYEEDQARKMPEIISNKLNGKPDGAKDTTQYSVKSEVHRNTTKKGMVDEDIPQFQSEELDLKKELSNTTNRLENLEKQYSNLIEIVNKINEKIESSNGDGNQKEKNGKMNVKTGDNKHPISYKEALEKLKSAMTNYSLETKKEEVITHQILQAYFDEKKRWKEGVFLGDKTYKCPINGKNCKSVKTMLKNAVEKKIAEINEQDNTNEVNQDEVNKDEINQDKVNQDEIKAKDYNTSL